MLVTDFVVVPFSFSKPNENFGSLNAGRFDCSVGIAMNRIQRLIRVSLCLLLLCNGTAAVHLWGEHGDQC